MQQEIEWSAGSRDKIYVSYNSGSFDDTLSITSDPNTGAARTKTIDVVAGNITRHIIVNQSASLPYDSRVEYLQSSGTQYIDTGVIVNDTDIIESTIMFMSRSGDNQAFGSGAPANQGGLWVEIYNNKTWYVRFGSSKSVNSTNQATLNTTKTVIIKKNYFSVNGTKILTPNYTSMPQQTLYLFSNHTSYPFVGRIYNFSITNSSNVKTLNLIPVRVGQVGYMYDTINNQLYGNIGTGDFTVGPDITS